MFELVREFWDFMRVRKKFWLLPIVLTLLLMATLVAVGQGSVVLPFVYTLF